MECIAARGSVVSLPAKALPPCDQVPSVVADSGFLESCPKTQEFLIGCWHWFFHLFPPLWCSLCEVCHGREHACICIFAVYKCIVPLGFLPWENQVAFPEESQLRQSRATYPTLHTGRFNVSTIDRILTRTTWSLTCAHMLMHAIAHGGVRTP